MAKAVTLKNNNNEEVYPVTDLSLVNGNIPTGRIADNAVTSDKVDFTTLYKSATPLSALLPVNANTETTVQSFSLPAGKWRIFWAVRGYGGENAQTNMIYAGLIVDGNKVQSLAENIASVGGTWRPNISSSYELDVAGLRVVKTYIILPMAGNVSADTTYLFALRVG